MVLVRRIVLNCLKHNILFQARHIPGLTNVLADHPSRQQIQQFLHKFSHNKLGGMPLQRGQLPRFAIHSFRLNTTVSSAIDS